MDKALDQLLLEAQLTISLSPVEFLGGDFKEWLLLQHGSSVTLQWDPTRGQVPGLCHLCLFRPRL